MTVETLSPTAAGTGMSDPQDILQKLDELMALPGAMGHHYQLVRQMLIDGRSIASYSLQELQELTGKSATTCKAIRRFVDDFEGRNAALGQDSDPCVHGASTCVQHVQYNMHEAETRPLTQQLLDLGWGQKRGRQVQDPQELMQTHGIDRVRQALLGATQPDVRNPAGFITWFLRQPSSQPASQPASKAETITDNAPTQRSPAPDTPQELLPALEWLRGEVRPQTWKSWFEDCRLTRSDDGVVVWLANPYVKHFVRDKFGPLLQTAVEETIGSGLRLSFEDYE